MGTRLQNLFMELTYVLRFALPRILKTKLASYVVLPYLSNTQLKAPMEKGISMTN
jgi:hypothetical protein